MLGNSHQLDITGGAVVFIKRNSNAKSIDSVERRKVYKWSEFLELSSHLFIGFLALQLIAE